MPEELTWANVHDHLCRTKPGTETTLKLKTLKALFLETGGRMINRGAFHSIKSKRLCPGVYKVWLDRDA